MPEHSYIVSPSIFVETPTKHLNSTQDVMLGDMACTQVSTPNSTTIATPHYLQQQQDESYSMREQTAYNNNLASEERNENPMNTLAAISESRLSFQTEQTPAGSSCAVQHSGGQANSVDVKNTSYTEDSVKKPGSRRWLFGANQSLHTVSQKVGKKPRPRGYSANSSNNMSTLEAPSLLAHSNVVKTEPLLVDLEAPRDSSRNPYLFVSGYPMGNSSPFPIENVNVGSSLRQGSILEDSSKLPVVTYTNQNLSSLHPNTLHHYRMLEEGKLTNSLPMQGHYLRRQFNESFEDATSSVDKNVFNSLPADTPSQRRERRKLARAKVRAANQLQKRQARDRMKIMEQVALSQRSKNVEVGQPSTVSPSEEFSYASSRQEDASPEDTKDFLDPKAVRAIRNREAALRSRQQAKARLKALENENAEFQQRLSLLERENMELRQELEKFKAFLRQKNCTFEHTEDKCRTTD